MSDDTRPTAPASPSWPALDYEAGRDTLATLHLWSQIVGKVRIAVSPWINHSWHATLYPDARGLTTGAIPHPARVFELIFDFHSHRLRVETGDGDGRSLALEPRSVASFHDELMALLAELGLDIEIHGKPNELPDPITPFAEDTEPRAYVGEQASLFHLALLQTQRVFLDFRAGFQGKVSPVHLFWGSFDLAVTRFSGRPAPPHPGGFPNLPDRITREAYSHEVSSAGFWAGNEMVPYAAYYAYAYPSPDGFGAAQVGPEAAFFHDELGEFLLPYEAVRTATDPDAALTRFLEDTYAAAADLAGWDREALERERGAPVD